MHALRTVLRRIISEEAGQSLVVVISSMTVLLGISAFGIDTATWMVKHHRAQLVADSAALAAAQCLANPGHSETVVINGVQTAVPACTSSSDTSDADTVAIDYAAANGFAITANNVSVANKTVTVNASATSPGFFSHIAGIASTSQSAGAAASWSASSAMCSTPGNGCDFMFAHDTSCASSSHGIYITQSGNATIQGNVQSNGDLSSVTSGTPQFGTGEYGPSCSPAPAPVYSGHYPWSSPLTRESAVVPYPIDYSKDFPACGGTGEAACVNGYPPFCTNAGSSITLTGSTNGDSTITNNVYCASGTGTKSDPSTWNGTITITLSGSETLYDTFVGGSVSFTGSGNDKLSSCGYTASGYSATTCSSLVPSPSTTNYPIFYATGTSSTAINVTVSGGQTFNGDTFAPNGGTSLTMSGNKTLTSFIESNDITATVSGTLQGDGPMVSGTGASLGGNVSLTQ